MKTLAIAPAAALVLGAGIAAPALAADGSENLSAPVRLLTNDLTHPMNVEGAPVFSWLPQDSDFDAVQSAYELVVRDAVTDESIWTSGKVSSAEQSQVAYDGDALDAARPYEWMVRTWDGDGDASPFSEPARFATGLDDADWDASWLQAPASIGVGSSPLSIVTGDGTSWLRVEAGEFTLAKVGQEWTDYTVAADIMIENTAAALAFRAEDPDNNYFWQVSEGRLRTHARVDGENIKMTDVSYPFEVGTAYSVEIHVSGTTIETFVDGELIDTTVDDKLSRGTVGFREVDSEVGRFANVRVVNDSGETLFEDDFDEGTGNWANALEPEPGVVAPAAGNDLHWYARKQEELSGKPVASAIAYIAGQHDYELNVNGERIGRGQSHEYSGETVYQGWDITSALESADEITLGVHHRWYSGGQGRAANVPGLIAHVVVYYEDGSSDTIVTDESWTAAAAPYGSSAKRNGEGDFIEAYDARADLGDVSEGDVDNSDWAPAYALGAHPTTEFPDLRPEIAHVSETLTTPVDREVLDDGATVFDFGVVIPARLSVHFTEGRDGEELRIVTGFERTDDGHVNTSNDSTQRTDMSYEVTQRDGEFTYDAFDHLGFRYLEVPDVGEEISLDDVSATILHTELIDDGAAEFSSSDDTLDAVFDLQVRSAKYSIQNKIVDTPTREKGQFLQDSINISAVTTMTEYERAASRNALMQFFDSADRFWDSGGDRGRYNSVYPNVDNKRDIPDFTLNVPEWVSQYYRQTGDRALLEYAYSYLQETAGYVARAIPETGPTAGLVTDLPGGSGEYLHGIVDWPSAGRFDYDMSTSVRTTVNALSVRVFDRLAEIATELGRPDAEVAGYESAAQDLREAMNDKLIADNGLYTDGLMADGTPSEHQGQHATSYPLAFEIAPAESIDEMADHVVSLGMKQGPMTADILVEALVDSGRLDDALTLFTNAEDFGWAQTLAQGGTFTWEQWQHGESQSHGWGATAVTNILEDFLGIRVAEAGAGVVEIAPAWGLLDSASGSVVTERGRVTAEWSGDGESAVLRVDVPTNVTAQLALPSVEGGRFEEVDGNAPQVEATADAEVVTVGSGERTFAFVPDEEAAPGDGDDGETPAPGDDDEGASPAPGEGGAGDDDAGDGSAGGVGDEEADDGLVATGGTTAVGAIVLALALIAGGLALARRRRAASVLMSDRTL